MRSGLLAIAVLAGLSSPAAGEMFTVSGRVQAIASGTPQGPALRAYVRNQDVDVLNGCQDGYAFVADLSANAVSNQQLVNELYYSGQRADIAIDKDEAGWCRIMKISSAD